MRAASTAAIAHAIARSRIRSASSSRRSAGSSFESRRPRIRCAGSRITAAATTGPNSEPRPTSSTPATSVAPLAQASFSNLSVQRSVFSKPQLRRRHRNALGFRYLCKAARLRSWILLSPPMLFSIFADFQRRKQAQTFPPHAACVGNGTKEKACCKQHADQS